MDNLIHASATPQEAEHEIKLWFKPSDIPPFMRAFPVVRHNAEEHFYCKDGALFTQHEPGSTCVLAPGDVMWESDVKALELIYQGKPSPRSLQTVVAKYLTNETPENC
jgi:nucleoside-diphosphate kinase